MLCQCHVADMQADMQVGCSSLMIRRMQGHVSGARGHVACMFRSLPKHGLHLQQLCIGWCSRES